MKTSFGPWHALAALVLFSRPGGAATTFAASVVEVSALDISTVRQDYGTAHADRAVEGRKLSIGGKTFEHGVGTHAASVMTINLAGAGLRFRAMVGIDDEAGGHSDPVVFHVVGDGRDLWSSHTLRAGSSAEAADVDVAGVKTLSLVEEPTGDGIQSCHADWAGAEITFDGPAPVTVKAPGTAPEILTPAEGPAPRINGPHVVGVRPGSPFLYTVPATGDRPMQFAAEGLPNGLKLDEGSGRITGALASAGKFPVTLRAMNGKGSAEFRLDVIVGDTIALTPPMGWNSWNCWGEKLDQEKMLRSARGMVKSGLIRHGWAYVNMDDTWQGRRGGDLNAIQPDPKRFPDMKGMCDEIHAMGLKVGIYSTPWVTSYAGRVGGSSEDAGGAWDNSMRDGPRNQKTLPYAIGRYHFFEQDAKQWGRWGIDYSKYDWAPDEVPETSEMADALRASGRDIVLSLSNNTPRTLFGIIPEVSKIANCWRTGDDIGDSWGSIAGHGFNQEKWAPFSGPGHWNDPDMFEVGANGGGGPKRLKPDEQYAHVSLWYMLSAPLLLGCDLDHLNPFTIGLLSNDEVLALDQDALGKQAVAVVKEPGFQILEKPLADGTVAVGLFNLGRVSRDISATWESLGVHGGQTVRDLWRQKDVGAFDGSYHAGVPPHGVVLVRLTPVR